MKKISYYFYVLMILFAFSCEKVTDDLAKKEEPESTSEVETHRTKGFLPFVDVYNINKEFKGAIKIWKLTGHSFYQDVEYKGSPYSTWTSDMDFCMADGANGVKDLIKFSQVVTTSGKVQVGVSFGPQYNSTNQFFNTSFNVCGPENEFHMADINGDGVRDVIKLLHSGNTLMIQWTYGSSGTIHTKYVSSIYGSSDWQFFFKDWNNDKKEDLFLIRKNNTGTGKTKVYILNAANSYSSYLLNSSTSLGYVGNEWDFSADDFNGDGKMDLYCFKRYNTGTNAVELQILSGYDNFQNRLMNDGIGITRSAIFDSFSCEH